MKRRILSIMAILFLVSISIPALAGTVEYTYDELNRVKSVIYEDGTTIEYDYDEVGNRTIRQVYSDTAPSADFVADNTNVEVGQTVNFTDQSTGDITTWSWDFDNNGTEDSAEQNPSYVYNTAGTYTVSLTVTGPGGSDTETKPDYIQVTEPPPVYVISGQITESGAGLDGVTVDLTGSMTDSTVTAGGGNYSFNVPDGDYTVTPSLAGYEFTPPYRDVPVSGADVPGQDFTAQLVEYTVTTTTVGNGTVNKTPDQATYHYDDIVQLEAVPDPDWAFSQWSGDLTGSTNPDTITMTGNMTITATFTEVGGQPPVADAGPDVNAKKLEYITFDGTGSYDPDGTITDYGWDFGDGKTGTGSTVVHKYTKTGTYTVTLTVTDNSGAQGQDTATATITN